MLNVLNKLRSVPWIYRLALGCRRCLVPAIKDAIWEFYRSFASLAWFTLYPTEALQKKSKLCTFIASIRNGPPFRLFSVYQALRCGYPKIEGRIVLEDQGYPVVREGSLLAHGTNQQHTEQPFPIFWSRHHNINLVSSSLATVTANKELCLESAYGYRNYRGDPACRYFRLPEPVILKENWTSIVSRWVPNDSVPNHSHWLLDALPRLALLPEFPADTKVIVPGKLAAYQHESLAMLGLTDNRIRFSPEKHFQVENYYFSSPPSMIVCHSPYAVRFLRDFFLKKADPDYHGPRRFYISRANAPRNVENNMELERFFLELGWGVMDLSQLTFAQEIRLFAEAEAVCGIFGSGLTNTLFCRPDCAVVMMAHDYWTDGVLDWIIQAVGIKKYSCQVYPANECRRFGVNLEMLKQQLDAVGFLS
jgi:hypothetical protein